MKILIKLLNFGTTCNEFTPLPLPPHHQIDECRRSETTWDQLLTSNSFCFTSRTDFSSVKTCLDCFCSCSNFSFSSGDTKSSWQTNTSRNESLIFQIKKLISYYHVWFGNFLEKFDQKILRKKIYRIVR